LKRRDSAGLLGEGIVHFIEPLRNNVVAKNVRVMPLRAKIVAMVVELRTNTVGANVFEQGKKSVSFVSSLFCFVLFLFVCFFFFFYKKQNLLSELVSLSPRVFQRRCAGYG